MPESTNYPARLSIDFPAQARHRMTTLFRLILAIPIFIILGMLMGGGESAAIGGVVVFPTLFFILFRQKYPRWWFDWNLAISRFGLRVGAYALLLTDAYPAAEEEQSVHFDLEFPDARRDLNRWLPLVKWLAAIPHFFILVFLFLGALGATLAAWFAILFTGAYPKSLFDFVVGVLRWNMRVCAYAVLLTTDEYPPFSLE